ncbi:MAG: NADH-quinone oxidoreductase subunit L [Candidatus Accumulibacter regalis]|jgi:NADH-quinone oxidoreductase subunit L|uniref:NADH-quinone oxidoreductase subunit L n=1 Tax=Accumulibacter regalis TaxID=522306 RepID=A0A011PSZ9_ACCRE|nr:MULTISPECIES: NADH-quinone oxidoreductase subunit L [unclassified Candidatus Accumulibacter]EXI90501.1 MAG: NADH-quinone oxidoreductase subunit L [Candidatus Accumulibacter regalis]HRE70681.1 NADH-quinone oxidoreductase subunit L [Accumulibacter sp.]HRE84912.1 NADH-quinone oxidoreductase subunit L [Accumulibacter sp.]HRI90489.1 NADH-quinone oxidoreductase subunit L [Accumulibacter sp.]
MEMQKLYLLVPLAPLFGAIIAGLLCRVIPRWVAHTVTIAGVAIAFIASYVIFKDVLAGNTFNGPVYRWLTSGDYHFEVGFLIDPLTVTMMLVVTFVSLMVHIYTIGYMQDDPGYNRFFSYISLFTFSMLMLVMSNNFMQLFFGWEAVGLVSYLLIGFWYTRPTAIFANMKAFLVNRVGDFGFILGIGLILSHFGTLDYAAVFAKASALAATTIPLFGEGSAVALMTAVCILLFIGAMGKSAQVPLHVWLPDSMEGPTPISALIHAATMVTAGIFMVARMSPLFELSDTALSFVIVIGAITALFMGFLGVIQNDIKRVVAYSTLSQLGYMTVALGASAYSVAIFHLMTHAFFKALLFLAAGSVIIGMHHDQDIRNMGGLRKYMPITWITSLVGSLALIGTPFFAGFYSKDSIIEAVALSHIPGSGFAYFAVMASVFVTALYSFRMYFLVFHGEERFGKAAAHGDHHASHATSHAKDEHHDDDTHHDEAHGEEHHGLAPGQKPHETPWVVTLPLILLAIPSAIIGFMTIEPMLFGDFFKGAIFVDSEAHPVMKELAHHFHGAFAMATHALTTAVFWLALSGVVTAWYLYMKRPDIPVAIKARFGALYTLLDNKYYFDRFNEVVFAGGARLLGRGLWKGGDAGVIDGMIVNGAVRLVSWFATLARFFQTGHIYHYAFTMIIGVFVLMTLWVTRA